MPLSSRWRSLAILSGLFVLPTGVGNAAPQSRSAFGPEVFTRRQGPPTTYERSFVAPASWASSYSLRIVNGDPTQHHGCASSAWVLIDGAQVVGPSDLAGKPPTIERTLTLAPGPHALTVRIAGMPGSHFSLTILGSVPLADLAEARSGHTATLLGDGRVLVVGGRGSSGYLAGVESFDFRTLSQTTTGLALLTARAEHSSSVLANGQLLVLGGRNDAGPLASAERLDLALGAFSPLSLALSARSGQTATVLLDGRVLLLGGVDPTDESTASGEVVDPSPDPLGGSLYDPLSGTVTPLQDVLRVRRAHHTATLLPNGQVLVIGGKNEDGVLASAEIIDTQTFTSTLLSTSLLAPRRGHTATLLADGSVLIAGGWDGAAYLDTLERFSPGPGTFEALSARLTVARAHHTATLLPLGDILITGGETANEPLAHTEIVAAAGPDAAAPHVETTLPLAGATGVALNTIVGLRLSGPVDPATVSQASVRVGHGGELVPGTVAISESGLLVFFVPEAPLEPGTTYTVRSEGVRDLAGQLLPTSTFSFTTALPPAITSFSPTRGLEGTVVTVTGERFDATSPAATVVRLGSTPAPVTAVTETTLRSRSEINVLTTARHGEV